MSSKLNLQYAKKIKTTQGELKEIKGIGYTWRKYAVTLNRRFLFKSDLKYSTALPLTSNSTLRVRNYKNAIIPEISSVISGSYSLTINNDLIFTGANSYGATIINNTANLQIGNGTLNGTIGGGNLTNNGTFTIYRTDTYSMGTIISGTGNFVKKGSNNLTLGGYNTYSGTTTIESGYLQMRRYSSFPTGKIFIKSGATLNLNNIGANSWNNFNNPINIDNGTMNFTTATYSTLSYPNLEMTGGTVNYQYSNMSSLYVITYPSPNVATISNGNIINNDGVISCNVARGSNPTSDLTINTNLKGTNTTLTKNGNGILTLTSANTFTGGSTINDGMVSITHASALGTGTITINSLGTLKKNGLTITNQVINNGGTIIP